MDEKYPHNTGRDFQEKKELADTALQAFTDKLLAWHNSLAKDSQQLLELRYDIEGLVYGLRPSRRLQLIVGNTEITAQTSLATAYSSEKNPTVKLEPYEALLFEKVTEIFDVESDEPLKVFVVTEKGLVSLEQLAATIHPDNDGRLSIVNRPAAAPWNTSRS